MNEALALYARALRDAMAADVTPDSLVRYEDGMVVPFPVTRYVGHADRLDLELLEGLRGPVLDVGCGPGRHLQALHARGTPALGIDLSPVAVEIARRGGAHAIVGDIFGDGDVPTPGAWRTALLLDGNVGIGGDPARLLRRVRSLLAPDGVALIELEPPGSATRSAWARIEMAGASSEWFPWARVTARELSCAAADVGMSMEREWSCGTRWFARLRPTGPV